MTTTSSSITFFTVSGLTRGNTYYFAVQAKNVVGLGPMTTSLSLRACQAPQPPTNILRLSFNSSTTMVIGWTAPTDTGGSPNTMNYQVFTDNGLGAGYTLLTGSTSGLTNFTVNVNTGYTYFFKIKSQNEVGVSGFSNPNTGFLAGSVPTEPINPTTVL